MLQQVIWSDKERKCWGFSEHQRCLLSSNFWASELDGKHWHWLPAPSVGEETHRVLCKRSGEEVQQGRRLCCFPQAVGKKSFCLFKALLSAPTFQNGFGIKKSYKFSLNMFKYLATECHLLKMGGLWFDVYYFIWPLRRRWNIVILVFLHIGNS